MPAQTRRSAATTRKDRPDAVVETMLGVIWPRKRPSPSDRGDAPGGRRKVPDGKRVYVVGDIHGRADLLAALHAQIERDARRHQGDAPTIVYLGDYVDRGPDSKEVLDVLIGGPLPGFEHVYLKGNHEDMMLRFLAGPPDPNWLFNGGDATLISYGVEVDFRHFYPPGLETLRARLQQSLPAAHRQFLEGLKLYHEEGDYLFVHAGLRPGTGIARQRPADLLWIRDAFLVSGEDFGKTVVHGHTIRPDPEVRPNRIGIDTGAFYTGRLTSLVLAGSETRFLHT
jgi:serine/threonine protein phosphatase 1